MLTAFNSPRQTTTPTRVFTVPDDCSTDDNEPFDDESPSSSDKGPTIIDLEEIPHTSRSPRTSVPQLDGIVDLVSEADDSESIAVPIENVLEEVEGEAHRINFRRRYHVDLLEDDDISIHLTDDNMSSTSGSEIGCCDMSGTPTLAHRLASSPSPSWDSSLSGSVDGHMDMDEHEHEDDASDHGSDQSVIFMSDSDSEGEDSICEQVLQHAFGSDSDSSELVQDTLLRSVGQPRPLVSSLPTQDLQSSSRWLPPINSLVSPGKLDWDTISLDPNRLRLSSPSDAALLHSNHRLETGNAKQQGTNDSENVMPQIKSTAVNDGQTAAKIIGQKSGKLEFFEAREHNKMTISRFVEHSVLPSPSERHSENVISAPGPSYTPVSCVPTVPSVCSNDTHNNNCHTYEPDTVADGPEKEVSGFIQYISGPSRFEFTRQSSMDVAATQGDTLSTLSWEPLSAWELQQQKRLKPDHEGTGDLQARTLKESIQQFRSPGFSFSCLPTNLAAHQQDAVEPREETSAAEMQKQSNNKRKAEMISELTEADMALSASWSSHLMVESQTKDGDITTRASDAASPLISPPSPPVRCQSNLPPPPTTPEATVNPETRPTKRMKKIAERVGYAALGGATVGAMVLTSLIYSAPTFA